MSPTRGRGGRPERASAFFCRRPAAGGKKGQDTKVSYPLLRLPNFPLRRVSVASRLKNEESTDFTSVLSFFSCHGSAIARFAAHISARPVCTGREIGGVEYFDVKSWLSGFLGCSRRAA